MKRSLHISRAIGIIIFSLIVNTVHSQVGMITGVIEDGELPLPGVNITIKGKNTGTQTDFDGYYRIKCEIGDTLIISYIGFGTKELKVTAAMFSEEQVSAIVRQVPVTPILSTSYQESVRKQIPAFLLAPSIEESTKTYKGVGYFSAYRIKNIGVEDNHVHLTYQDPDIFYEVGASTTIGLQFIQNRNLPATQNNFAQGIPLEGNPVYQGPENDIPFSYGPALSGLEFDGNEYPFDSNGRLVSTGNGNGNPAKAYKNSLFQEVLKTNHRAYFNIASQDYFLQFDYRNQSAKDLYDKEKSILNELDFNFNNRQGYQNVEWDVLMNYVRSTENQPNTNGFHNNLLLNALVAPVSFDTHQGTTLPDGNQRSFSISNFNNPNWLLNRNRNRTQHERLLTKLQVASHLSEDIELIGKASFHKANTEQSFGLLQGTVGFREGYSSDKTFERTNFNGDLTFQWDPYGGGLDFKAVSTLFYTNESLDYRLTESVGYGPNTFSDPLRTSVVDKGINRSAYRWLSRFDFEFMEQRAKVSFFNNSYSANIQNQKWFLPTVQCRFEFADGWYSDTIRSLNLTGSWGNDVNFLNLFYGNQSHNSLLISPGQSLAYTANNDLFANDAVSLEEKTSYEVSLDLGLGLFDHFWNINATFFHNQTDGAVFPIRENGQFLLRNIADVQNAGFEASIEGTFFRYNDFSFTPRFIFSTYNTKVLRLLSTEERVPFAGFSTISRNLIEGQPAGVLVGSRYARNAQNQILIDAAGFPIVASEPGVIGDPIPDFNMGFSSNLNWKGLTFDFVIDYQKGGDIWNGTQQVLNYFGRSQESETARTIRGFIFNGVDPSGESNTVPVDFANPANGLEGNRYVRYGFEGVAEEAIVDGTYLNLKAVNFSYKIEIEKGTFFRELEIGLYGNNLFTVSKFRGATPYNYLFDQSSSQGLHFFNGPLTSEIGMKLNLKI